MFEFVGGRARMRRFTPWFHRTHVFSRSSFAMVSFTASQSPEAMADASPSARTLLPLLTGWRFSLLNSHRAAPSWRLASASLAAFADASRGITASDMILSACGLSPAPSRDSHPRLSFAPSNQRPSTKKEAFGLQKLAGEGGGRGERSGATRKDDRAPLSLSLSSGPRKHVRFREVVVAGLGALLMQRKEAKAWGVFLL